MSAAQMGGFNCPHCGQHYSLTPEQAPQYAGQTIACSVCQKQFTVPMDVGASGALPPIPPFPAAEATPQQAYPPQSYSPQAYPQQFGPRVPVAGYAEPMMAPPTSGMAITSMVLGLLFFIPIITGLLAVIFGIIGIKQTSERRLGGRGFALAGLICGGLSLLMWGGCFLTPLAGFNGAMRQARKNAQTVGCASHLRQIGQGILLYANDNGGKYPSKLGALIENADLAPDVFVCPLSGDTPATGANAKAQAANLQTGGHLSYVYVGQNLDTNSPATAVLAYERVGNHGNAGTNVLFNDGHVAWYDAEETRILMSELNAGRNPPQNK